MVPAAGTTGQHVQWHVGTGGRPGSQTPARLTRILNDGMLLCRLGRKTITKIIIQRSLH